MSGWDFPPPLSENDKCEYQEYSSAEQLLKIHQITVNTIQSLEKKKPGPLG